MKSIETLVKVLEYQAERRKLEAQSDWPSRSINVRLDAPYLYMLDRLACKFGLPRGSMLRELVEVAVNDAYFEAFKEQRRNPDFGFEEAGEDGQTEFIYMVTMPAPAEVNAFMERTYGEAQEREAPVSVSILESVADQMIDEEYDRLEVVARKDDGA